MILVSINRIWAHLLLLISTSSSGSFWTHLCLLPSNVLNGDELLDGIRILINSILDGILAN